MFNNYYEDIPVGYNSLPEQKEAMGYKDDTYIVDGKGLVGKSQLEALGFVNFVSANAYAAGQPVIYNNKKYALIAAHTAGAAWDAANATEINI